MYEKVLVPLDGSDLSECVFPYIKAFVEECQVGHIVFVRVVEPYTILLNADYMVSSEILEGMDSAQQTEAKEYLNKVIKRFQHNGTAIHSEILVGRAAETLANYTKKNDIDLIIIATHGRSGLTRLLRGSVAEKILRFSSIPVFMVRAPGTT
jgi:nucleotide-binding universal stress UspA family protein